MTAIDTGSTTPRSAARRHRAPRPASAAGRLRSRLSALEAERELHAKARFDTGGDAGDRAWRVEGETQLLQLDEQIRRLRSLLEGLSAPAAAVPRDRVAAGVTVDLRFLPDSSIERYAVGGASGDEDFPGLTLQSPLGRVLLGARAGDTVEYASPRGTARVLVVAIG